MKKLLILLNLLLCFQSAFAVTYIWTGATSSAWNVSSNWSPSTGFPIAGDVATINNASVPNICILDANRTIANLNVSAGSLDLGGFLLTVSTAINFTGGIVQNGSLSTLNLTNISATTFNGTVSITKTGAGGHNDLSGGNTFNGLITFINNSTNTARIRLANTTGDTFNSDVIFSNTSIGGGAINIGFSGINTFNGDVTLNNTSTGGMSIGNGAANSTFAANKSITTSGFTSGPISINRTIQSGTTGLSFAMTGTSCTISSSTLICPFSAIVTGDITMTSSTIDKDVTFTAQNVTLTNANNLANVSGNIAITKTANNSNHNDWTGGNTFGNASGTMTITNNSSNTARIRMANSSGDVINCSSTFTNASSGGGAINIGFSGTNTFNGDFTLNNTSTGGMSMGNGAANSTFAANKSITTSGFTSGPISINRTIQSGTTGLSFAMTGTSCTISSSTLICPFSAIVTGDITMTSSTIDKDVTFTAQNVTLTSANNLANVSGNIAITKTANNSNHNDWTGGNTFGNASGTMTITNNSTNTARIRMANSSGDVINCSSTFTNASSGGGAINIGFSGTNTFNGDFTLNNTSTGGMSMGNGAANSTFSANKSITTSGFTSGPISINRTIQSGTTGLSFAMTGTSCTISSSTLICPFSAIVTGDITMTSSTIDKDVTFTAQNVTLTSANNLANVSGNIAITKTANNSNHNDWTGGNTFGNASGTMTITNNSTNTARIRMANSSGDVINCSSTFTNASSGGGAINIGFSGTNTFNGDFTLNNTSTGGMSMGNGAANSTFAANKSITTSGFTSGPISINRTIQSGTTGLSFAMTGTSCTISSSTLICPFSAIVTGDITMTSSTIDKDVTFTAQNVTLTNANNLANVSGNIAITKTANNSNHNDWTGGNTFGNASGTMTITNNSSNTARIRMAAINGDTFKCNVLFQNNSTGGAAMDVAFANTSLFEKDISSVGSANNITYGANNGIVNIAGTTTQNFSGDAVRKPSIPFLSMNNSSGGLVLAVPMDITNTLTLNTGNITTTTTHILNFTDEAVSTTVGNSNSFVNGPMQINFTNNSASLQTIRFPIGKSADWRPVVLRVSHSATTGYTYRAEVFNASARALGYTLPASVDTVSDVHYWDVDRYLTSTMVLNSTTNLRTGGALNPEITLYFGVNDAVYQGPNLTIVKNTNVSPTTWFDIGGTSTVGSSPTPVAGSVTSTSAPTAFNSFSRFTLGSLPTGWNSLPVELLNFSAVLSENKVNVNWSTATETATDYFEVQRSQDGIIFENVTQVQAAGESNLTQYYSMIDSNPFNGTSYYRLKMVDQNGNYDYSETNVVKRSDETVQWFEIYPNPSSEGLVFLDLKEQHELLFIEVYDVTGKLCHKELFENVNGQITVSLPAKLKGVFYFRVGNGDLIETKKIILN